MSKPQDQNVRNTSIQWTDESSKYDAQQQLDELEAQRQQPTLRKPDIKILKSPFRDENDELNHLQGHSNDTLLPFRVRLSVHGEEPVETTVAIKSDHIECPKMKHIAFDKLTEIRINTGNSEKEKYGEGSFTVIFKSHPFRFEAKDKEERGRILQEILKRFPECNIHETNWNLIESENSEFSGTLQNAPEDDMIGTQENELHQVSDLNKLEHDTKHLIHEHKLRDRLREEIKEKLEKLKADTKAIEEKQQEIAADAQQTRQHLDVERETFLRALNVDHSLNEHQIQEITLRISKDEEHRYSELERKHNELIEDEKQIQIGFEFMRKQMELQRAELVDAQNQMDAERRQIEAQREILKEQQNKLENDRSKFQSQKSRRDSLRKSAHQLLEIGRIIQEDEVKLSKKKEDDERSKMEIIKMRNELHAESERLEQNVKVKQSEIAVEKQKLNAQREQLDVVGEQLKVEAQRLEILQKHLDHKQEDVRLDRHSLVSDKDEFVKIKNETEQSLMELQQTLEDENDRLEQLKADLNRKEMELQRTESQREQFTKLMAETTSLVSEKFKLQRLKDDELRIQNAENDLKSKLQHADDHFAGSKVAQEELQAEQSKLKMEQDLARKHEQDLERQRLRLKEEMVEINNIGHDLSTQRSEFAEAERKLHSEQAALEVERRNLINAEQKLRQGHEHLAASHHKMENDRKIFEEDSKRAQHDLKFVGAEHRKLEFDDIQQSRMEIKQKRAELDADRERFETDIQAEFERLNAEKANFKRQMQSAEVMSQQMTEQQERSDVMSSAKDTTDLYRKQLKQCRFVSEKVERMKLVLWDNQLLRQQLETSGMLDTQLGQLKTYRQTLQHQKKGEEVRSLARPLVKIKVKRRRSVDSKREHMDYFSRGHDEADNLNHRSQSADKITVFPSSQQEADDDWRKLSELETFLRSI